MKNKLLLVINVFFYLIILILLAVYFNKNKDSTIQGSYQMNHSDQVIQLVIDGDKYTEYVESKLTDTGEIYKSNENSYILDNGKQKLFLYKNKKDILYFNQNLDDNVLLLKKLSDTPTYITQ